MYFSRNKHILSTSLMAAALINIISAMIGGLVRIIVNRSASLAPDMADSIIWRIQIGVSAIQLILVCGVFWFAFRKLNRYINAVSDDDRAEMGRLQEEVFGDKLPALSADAIKRLLQIWAVILIGVEFIYDITSSLYREFMMQLFAIELLTGGLLNGGFTVLYNSTHGFKYLGMLIAILLGIMMTGIFLNDRPLKIVAGVLTVLFLIAFAVFQMNTISIFGRSIGVVWTSVIFHATETIGLFTVAIYMRTHYSGV
ncbi:MAG: hypothetical protein IJ075_00170 [Lachnospiraceae bacterium]|nr:hypothetical protein [Lachnospiraceae bacterium]